MSLPKDTVPDRHADPLVASVMRAAEGEAPDCPDAELLGLYADRDLDRDAAARIETHVHDCARCQAIVAAYARSLPDAVAGGVDEAAGGWFAGWRWLVPAGSLAAAVVVAVWVGRGPADDVAELVRLRRGEGCGLLIQARPDAVVEATPRRKALSSSDGPTAASQAGLKAVRPPVTASTPGALARATEAPPAGTRAEAEAIAERMTRTRPAISDRSADRGTRPEAPPAAAKSAVAAAENRAAAPQETLVVSPSSPAAAAPAGRPAADVLGANDFRVISSNWRARDGQVERTRDQGRSWQRVAMPAGVRVVDVASPGGDVCWAIADEAVLRTLDGTTWVRTARPTSERLATVGAESATAATVVTATGAVFETSDGGRTWSRMR